MKICVINSNGMQQIRKALIEHHYRPIKCFSSSMLRFWAQEAEDHYNDGAGCYIEIRRYESRKGMPICIEITQDGYDLRDVIA